MFQVQRVFIADSISPLFEAVDDSGHDSQVVMGGEVDVAIGICHFSVDASGYCASISP